MIPFSDFKGHYAAVKAQVDESIQRVMDSGWYVLGKEVEAFESEFAQWLGAEHVVSCASGTEAIALALMAFDIGQGDEVITTSLTAFPTITGINQVGATPVVVDVLQESALINPDEIAKAITPKTRAILPVHLYGQSCDLSALRQLADKHDLVLIEDCAQSTGSQTGLGTSGTIGDAGCFSFYPTKNLGAFGDGGAVSVKSEKAADKLRSLRNYGQTERYYHDFPGINSRLDEMQAAVLRAKLPMLQSWNERRQAIAASYHSILPEHCLLSPATASSHVYHLFVIKTANRDRFMASMKERGIGTLIH